MCLVIAACKRSSRAMLLVVYVGLSYSRVHCIETVQQLIKR